MKLQHPAQNDLFLFQQWTWVSKQGAKITVSTFFQIPSPSPAGFVNSKGPVIIYLPGSRGGGGGVGGKGVLRILVVLRPVKDPPPTAFIVCWRRLSPLRPPPPLWKACKQLQLKSSTPLRWSVMPREYSLGCAQSLKNQTPRPPLEDRGTVKFLN